MSDSYEFHFEGLDVPEGEIRANDLAAFVTELQRLTERIGQQMLDRSSRRRPSGALGRFTEVRLSGIRPGSTTLEVRIGEPDTIALGDDETTVLNEKFVEVISGIARNVVPTWVSPPIALAALGFVESVHRMHPKGFKLARPEDPSHEPLVRAALPEVEAEPWALVAHPREKVEPQRVAISGTLEAVDLKTHRFRVRDDAGNATNLLRVPEVSDVGRLIGRRVVAEGDLEVDAMGRQLGMRPEAIRLLDLPDFDGPLEVVRLPVPDWDPDDDGFDEDELAAALEALRS